MRRTAITATLLLLATAAQAQDISPALDMTLMSGWSGQGAALEQMKRDTGARIARRQPAPRAAVDPRQVLVRTAFRADPAVRRQVHLHAVAAIQKASPVDAAQLRTKLANGTILSAATQYLGRYGMSPNNVVDTTALYLASAWFASRASAGDPSPAQMKGLRRQVAVTYSTMPQVLGASNAAKQELAETNIIQAVIAGSLANAAAADPKVRPSIRASVAGAVRDTYRLDLTRLNLTPDGLR